MPLALLPLHAGNFLTQTGQPLAGLNRVAASVQYIVL
jgi:hypothetical protein